MTTVQPYSYKINKLRGNGKLNATGGLCNNIVKRLCNMAGSKDEISIVNYTQEHVTVICSELLNEKISTSDVEAVKEVFNFTMFV